MNKSSASISPYDRDFLLRPREPGISRLDRIPIRDCGEPLVCLRGISPRIRLKCPIPWARKRVGEMLVEAASRLPEGMFLRITTALRTRKMQEKAYRLYLRKLRRQHPGWPYAVLRREANRFFHPHDSISPPGHSTGGAADVELIYANGRRVDTFSSTIVGAQTWATFCPHLTAKARANRALLYNAMLAAGFTNCYEEWWHYSYGDLGWAERLGKPFALYGMPAEIPPALARLIPRAEKKPLRRPRL